MEPRRRDKGADRLSPTGSAIGRALVIEPVLRRAAAHATAADRSSEAKLDEATGLARAIDLDVAQAGIVMLRALHSATYLSKGKVEEIAGLVKTFEAGIVVMDCALSPVQQRNLEKAWNAKVIDRTGLILEIFGRRARTREGALQVEHAHLTYQKGRLVRTWTHLERQRGGYGFLGGPGETQLEADRRLIDERLAKIETELEKVKRTRSLHRDSRKRVPYPIVALVGYTNAGKSTLFNRMTRANVLSADMLFATLDPTLRAVDLPHGVPHHPLRHGRFHLRPADHADRRVPRHARRGDRSRRDPACARRRPRGCRSAAGRTSKKSCASSASIQLNNPNDKQTLIEVWNKIDRLDADERARLQNIAERRPAEQRPALVSAMTGEGLDALAAAIEDRLGAGRVLIELQIDPADGAGVSWLHRHTEVIHKAMDENSGRLAMTVRAAADRADAVRAKFARAGH